MNARPAQSFATLGWLRGSFAAVLLCAGACGGKYTQFEENSTGATGAREAVAGHLESKPGAPFGGGGYGPLMSEAGGRAGVNSAGALDAPGSAGAPGLAGGGSAGDAPSSGALSPSCRSLPATCGPSQNENCCAVRDVPAGSFTRRANGATFPATVSRFVLDRYEITVGRFRRF